MLISVPARAGLWEPLAEQIMALQALWISLLLHGGCLCERLILSGTANEEQMKISTTMVEMEQHISVPSRVASLSCSARHSRSTRQGQRGATRACCVDNNVNFIFKPVVGLPQFSL